ncbi:hypothetical protein NA57DRAFT_61615 [Rhizodiscina lignyota]|uniref:Caib baif family enzyme n=1 Tax=Rhizodiscina lignyota TaxID=1504668 RepID=A0A9P4I1Z2_9PEZI|nr:hypothetical protein NA57DRAFT_61615 [Rhizodiscina lignyota]
MAPSRITDEIKILTPVGMIGYGFNEDLFWKAVGDGVDAIIADCGSTDSGPQKLAQGTTTVTREAYVRDLDVLLAACSMYRVPILLGSAGGDGSDEHVELFVQIMKEITEKKMYRTMNVVTIKSEIDKDFIKRKLSKGEVSPCSRAVPELTVTDIDQATRIVAQMGLEPYVEAMSKYPDFDIIIGGRSYDPAMYAAFCLHRGINDLGVAYHMGKIMECGAQCSRPKSKEALAIVRQDSFDIIPLDPASRCTELSVAAHTLYEKTRPDVLVGPGGELHLQSATYEQLKDGRTVRVAGGKFVPVKPGEYTLKMEGARVSGYRSVFIGAFRDPILISQIESFLQRVQEFVKSRVDYPYELKLHPYGVNAVMGPLDPGDGGAPKEVCVCGEAKAPSQAQANHVVNIARIACVHGPYPHQLATSGNFAMPFAPYDIPLGQISEFNVYHLLEKVDPVGLFPINYRTVEGEGSFARQKTAPETNGIVLPSSKQMLEAKAAIAKANQEISRPWLKPDPPAGQCYLGDIADVVRSKNAGPFELTIDVMFNDEELYQRVKKTGVLSLETAKKLYHIGDDDVLACLFWDQARAFKTTIKRPIPSGSFGETDVHGSQQHIPLLYTLLPIPRS